MTTKGTKTNLYHRGNFNLSRGYTKQKVKKEKVCQTAKNIAILKIQITNPAILN